MRIRAGAFHQVRYELNAVVNDPFAMAFILCWGRPRTHLNATLIRTIIPTLICYNPVSKGRYFISILPGNTVPF
jgi:hypothetical protein